MFFQKLISDELYIWKNLDQKLTIYQWFGLNYGLNSQFFFIDNYFGDDAETGIGLGLNIMNHHESVTRNIILLRSI